MNSEPENYPIIAADTPPRRPWVTPRIIVGECGDSEAGNGIYASDIATSSANFSGS